jgi:hypothetical protein
LLEDVRDLRVGNVWPPRFHSKTHAPVLHYSKCRACSERTWVEAPLDNVAERRYP